MNRQELIARVRSLTRDLSDSIFREVDIVAFLNEGINRFRQRIPELRTMSTLQESNQSVTLLPEEYHELIALFSASRCFGQDERHYQASTYMNEFETKLDELKALIESGDIVIDGSSELVLRDEYVRNNYFDDKTYLSDVDDGVEGVE